MPKTQQSFSLPDTLKIKLAVVIGVEREMAGGQDVGGG